MPPDLRESARRHRRSSPSDPQRRPSHARASPQAIRAQALRDARNAERGDFGDSATARGGARPPRRSRGRRRTHARWPAWWASSSGTQRRRRALFRVLRMTERRNVTRWAGRTARTGGAARSASARLLILWKKSRRSGTARRRAPRASQKKASTNGTNRWGARKGTNAAAENSRNIVRPEDSRRLSYGGAANENVIRERERDPSDLDPTYQNSLVGGWDAGSSRWDTSSVPDSDVRSVYSAALEDSFGVYALPDAPADGMARVDERGARRRRTSRGTARRSSARCRA